MKRIVLASASPRRVELLKKITQEFEIIPCTLPEEHPDLKPCEFVKSLAKFKAQNVFNSIDKKENIIVIGSDTIVVKNNKVIGKPIDREDAVATLKKLSGRCHRVFTGVCLISQGETRVFCVSSIVKFYKLTDLQINEYVDSGRAMDKAGSYGVQDSGFVKKVYGSIDCVVGLPTEKLKKELKAFIKE